MNTHDTDVPIGRRLREIRAVRDMSQRAVAELAGISKSQLSRIERGEQAVDSRSTLEGLARALRVAPADLTGQPYLPSSPAEADEHSAVYEIRAVMQDIDIGFVAFEPGDSTLTVAGLEADIDRANDLDTKCAYHALGDLLPGLIARTHALVASGSAEAQRLFASALKPAFHLSRNLGHHDVGWTIARHLHAAASAFGDPAWIGLADFLRAEAIGGNNRRSRALELVETAANQLTPDSGPVGEVFGMLRLSAALQCAATGATDNMRAFLDEAAEVAKLTKECNFGEMQFGTPNVGVWKVALAVETGDFDRIPDLAGSVNVRALPSAERLASFYNDVGRGLAIQRGKEDQAVEALSRAESLAPDVSHANPFVREAVTELLRRARRDAGGRELRGMAYRMGMTV